MATTRSIDGRLAELGSQQFGVFHVHQVRDAGISYECLRRRVEHGILARLMPGVYAFAHVATAPSEDARAMAGVLFGGPGAALSLEAAAHRLGAWKRASGRRSIACRRTRNMRPPEWLHLWRTTTLRPRDVVVLDRVPTTNMTRTACDLGRVLTPWQLASVFGEAAFLGLLDLPAVQAMLRSRGNQPGTAVVAKAIALHLAGSAGTRSVTEDRFLRAVLGRGLPEPLVNQRSSTGVRGVECDFVWPEFRLVVEIDGVRVHGRPGAARWDSERDIALGNAGWRVIRISSTRIWRDLQGVIHEVRAAMFLA